MTEENWAVLVRSLIILMSVVVVVRQSAYTLRYYQPMAGALVMKAFAFMGLAFAGGWGAYESMEREIPIGPRTYVLFIATLWATIAVLLPRKYQPTYDVDEKEKDKK